MDSDFPILEFDGELEAVIEPSKVIRPISIPEHCVLPIYHTVIAKLMASSRLQHVTDIRTAMGPLPVYKLDHGNTAVTVAHPGLPAPLAAGVMEELIALGCRKFVACGSAGVLDSALATGTVWTYLLQPDSLLPLLLLSIPVFGPWFYWHEPLHDLISGTRVGGVSELEAVLTQSDNSAPQVQGV